MALADIGLPAYRYNGNGFQAGPTSSGSSFTAMPIMPGNDPSSATARMIGAKVVSSGGVVYIRTAPSSTSSATINDVPVNGNETVFLLTGGDKWVSVLADAGTVRCNVWPIGNA